MPELKVKLTVTELQISRNYPFLAAVFYFSQIVRKIRQVLSSHITAREVLPINTATAVGLLSMNLLSLVIFGAVAFQLNEPNLLQGLDGSYMMTIVKQQSLWTEVALGFTNNFFQSLGNVWFPLNTKLIPGYFISAFLNGGEVSPVVSYEVFSIEVFLSAYLLSLFLRLGNLVATLSAWGLVLVVMPYFGYSKLYGVLALTPHLATFMLCTIVVVMLFYSLGRGKWGGSLASLVGVMFVLMYLALSQPIFFFLILPILFVLGISMVAMADSRYETYVKLAGAVIVLVALTAGGVPEFLLGLHQYTAAYSFKDELINPYHTWTFVSIAFQGGTLGVWGRTLYAAAILGGLVYAVGSRGVSRTLGVGLLVAIGMLLAFGALIVYADFWRGPAPLYFEFLLWPFYAAYGVASLCIIGRAFNAKVHSLTEQSPARWYSKFLHSRSYGLNLILLSFPCLFLLISFHSSGPKERTYPYPPKLTPIIKKLREEIALESGEPFRGRVATFTGQSLQRSVSWLELHAIDSEVVKRFGNDHRTVGLWYYDIPTLFEYNQFITPAFYLVTRTFLARDGDRQVRNVMALRRVEPKILLAMGVRFVVTDAPLEIGAQLRIRLDGNGSSDLFLYELTNTNVGDFSPTESLQVPDAHEALSAMMRPDFDARRIVITETPLSSNLMPVSSSQLFVEAGKLRISARSQGTSIVVLPLEYSHCLVLRSVSSESPTARLFRANLLQTGILFRNELEATLTLFTGPFHNAGCRLEDAREIDRLGFKLARPRGSVPTGTPHSS